MDCTEWKKERGGGGVGGKVPGDQGRGGERGEGEKGKNSAVRFYIFTTWPSCLFFISSCPNCSYIFAIRSQLCFYSLSQLFIFHFYKWVLTVFHIFTACPNCFFYIYFNKMYQLVLHFYIVSNCFFYEFQSCPNF